MTFDFRLFGKAAYRSIFHTRGTHARLTPRRIGCLLLFAALYCAAEAANWLGFLLDGIFFAASRQQKIAGPVFIIGPPRSGTTYLQRLLAQDETRFTSMKSWEIFFAPSVTQKKIFKALGAIDRRAGSPLFRLVTAIEKRLYKNLSTMHRTSLFEAEEDGMLLLHIFSSATAFFVLPFKDLLWPYFLFDREVDPGRRSRIMAFYRRCVQNHLFVFGPDRQFLSKNPMFSTMVQSLDETFPDAKFVFLARTPFKTVPSTVSMLSYYFNSVMSPLEPYPFLEEQLDMLLRYYTWPLQFLDRLPPERQQIIAYNELVDRPARTVSELCSRFGIETSGSYLKLVKSKQARAQKQAGSHRYSLEQFGLTQEKIREKYAPVFKRFGFEN